jgi:hypothetical protein
MRDMKIALDAEGKIGGLLLVPHANTENPVHEKQETQLSLPFGGTWLTFWGGDTRELNQHDDVPAQKFASSSPSGPKRVMVRVPETRTTPPAVRSLRLPMGSSPGQSTVSMRTRPGP